MSKLYAQLISENKELFTRLSTISGCEYTNKAYDELLTFFSLIANVSDDERAVIEEVFFTSLRSHYRYRTRQLNKAEINSRDVKLAKEETFSLVKVKIEGLSSQFMRVVADHKKERGKRKARAKIKAVYYKKKLGIWFWKKRRKYFKAIHVLKQNIANERAELFRQIELSRNRMETAKQHIKGILKQNIANERAELFRQMEATKQRIKDIKEKGGSIFKNRNSPFSVKDLDNENIKVIKNKKKGEK